MKSATNIDPMQMHAAATKASSILKTLSHKDRLMILCSLGESELSVSELAQALDIAQSPLSQHLARMRHEGLVKTRREAQTIYYSLKSDEAIRIIGLLYELYCDC